MEPTTGRVTRLVLAMETTEGATTPYEVYCHRCRVSHPVGTRICLHCGGRVGRNRAPVAFVASPGGAEAAAEEDVPRRSGLFSPMSFLWIVLIVGGAMYRACTGGA